MLASTPIGRVAGQPVCHNIQLPQALTSQTSSSSLTMAQQIPVAGADHLMGQNLSKQGCLVEGLLVPYFPK